MGRIKRHSTQKSGTLNPSSNKALDDLKVETLDRELKEDSLEQIEDRQKIIATQLAEL